jgi:hypothetical protein
MPILLKDSFASRRKTKKKKTKYRAAVLKVILLKIFLETFFTGIHRIFKNLIELMWKQEIMTLLQCIVTTSEYSTSDQEMI